MIEFFITTTATGRLDVTERIRSWRASSRVPGGWWDARMEINAPERDLWRLVDAWPGGELEIWDAGQAIWRGELARVRLRGVRLRLDAVGDAQKLTDSEYWRIISDPTYRRWVSGVEPPPGFVSDNNNRAYVAAGGSVEITSGDEVTVEYPDDETELGAGIVRVQATATVEFVYGALIAELRDDAGNVLWSATASISDEEIDVAVDDADGLVFALRATATYSPKPEPPTLERVGATGNLSNGSYGYRVTLEDANGESEPSNLARITINDNTTAGQVEITEIPSGHAGTTARHIYRTEADGGTLYLLATLADNVTTSYTDNTADGGLGAELVEPDDESYAKLTSVVVRTLYPATTSDVVEEVLDGQGLDLDVTATAQTVTRAVYQRARSTRLTAIEEMAELGDGSEGWVFVIYDGTAAFRAWGDADWLVTPELLDRIELEWDRSDVYNAVRAELPDGWRSVWYTDTDSIAKFGRRERTINAPDTSRAEAQTMAEVFLADNAWPMPGLSLEAGARLMRPDGALMPGSLVRAGDVVTLRDVLPYEDLDVQIAEVEVRDGRVRLTPRGAPNRLESMLAEFEQRRRRAEEQQAAEAQQKTAQLQTQSQAIERLTFGSAATASGGGGGGAEETFTEVEHAAIGDSSPHHARLHDVEAAADHETTETDTDLALRPDGAGGVAFEAVDHSELTGVGAGDHHARYTDAEAEAVADTQIATHTSDADAHHDRLHDIDSAADHNGVLGVPIRMDIHGIPMDAGFEMDNGRLMGYNV